MTDLRITVVGRPAPQGSKRGIVIKGKAVLVESSKERVRSWREDVRAAALQVITDEAWEQATGPVALDVTFAFQRPRSHYRTGRNAHLLRDDAPHLHTQAPDLDKIIRSTGDALTSAGVYRDDKQVARLVALKLWHEAASCAVITVAT